MTTGRIGVYAGTFDPVHAGHIAFARAALDAAQLDTVVFIPETLPRRKQVVTTIDHRLRMLSYATEKQAGLSVAGLRSDQFTVAQTLPELKGLYPNATLCFLFGSDIVAGLRHWPDIRELIRNHQIVIGLRSGEDSAEIRTAMEALGREYDTRCTYATLRTSHAALTSSAIRSGYTPEQVDDRVASYIAAQGLYLKRIADTVDPAKL